MNIYFFVEGTEQAEELAHKLQQANRTDPDVQSLLGLNNTSMVVSSPLRRCLSTAAVGLSASLAPAGPRRIVVLPSLQEISCNPDTLAITPVKTQPLPSWLDRAQYRHTIPQVYASCDVSAYSSQKPLRGSGLQRLAQFSQWVFSGSPSGIDTIVISGHSFWFRFFFRTYLPQAVTSALATEAKALKICNGGAVAVDFYKDSADNCWLDENSIRVISGKFIA